MLSGDHRVVKYYVTASCPAQDVFPVCQGLTGSVWQGQIGPDLWLWRGLDEGANDAHQHGQSQQGEEKAQNQGVPGESLRVVCRQLPQGEYAGLKIVEKLGQVHPSFQNGEKRFAYRILQLSRRYKGGFAQTQLEMWKKPWKQTKNGAAAKFCCRTAVVNFRERGSDSVRASAHPR